MTVLVIGEGLFVNFDTQTRSVGPQFQITVFRQVGLVDPVAPIGFGGQDVFENLEIGCRGAEMQVNGSGKRAHRVVGGDTDVVGFGNGVDLLHLQEPATDADIGLDDVGALIANKIEELVKESKK